MLLLLFTITVLVLSMQKTTTQTVICSLNWLT